MASFSYRVLTPDGKEKKGTVVAVDKTEAMEMVKLEGVPVEVRQAGALDKEINLPVFKKRVSIRDLCVFCRQFQSILSAGVSVVQALDMLGDQTENATFARSIKNVKDNVEKGDSLSEAMKKEPEVYPKLLVSMVEAGEASGSLEVALERMSVQFEKDNKIKSMVSKAMIYPCVILVVMIIVVIIMLVFVIPIFMDMFTDLGVELPFITRMLIAFSDFLQTKWFILVAVIAAVVFAYRTYNATDSGAHVIAAIKLKIPVLGNLIMKTACSRLTRNLSTLLAAGMSMMDALEICAGTMDNIIYRDAIITVKDNVTLGSSLARELEVTQKFPPMVVHMVGIGEETGNLESMLESVANYYDEEVETATAQLTSMMEPMIIVVMGVVVGVVVLAVYSPMLSLYSSFE
jgi:type IV pilus assembly protein PilC